jgi:putative membrane protein
LNRYAILALIVGVIGAVAVVAAFGASAVATAIIGMGWLGFLAFCLAHGPVVALLGLGWRVCLPRTAATTLHAMIWSRILRDAGGELLPFSAVGGFLVGVRAAVLGGLTGAEASASTLVDITTEAVAQLAFIALGLIALADLQPDAPMIRPALIAVAAAAAIIAGLALLLRYSRRLSRLAGAGARRWLGGLGPVDNALAALRDIVSRPGAVAASLALHFVAWLGVALEGWLALRLIGAPISIENAVVLESLLFASRSLAFFMPNALGVQEGAYALLAPLVGLTPADALALSLIKRARDLAIGAPALLVWQKAEAVKVFRAKLKAAE